MAVFQLSSINVVMGFLLIIAGVWAYIQNKSLSALLIACAYVLFVFLRIEISLFYSCPFLYSVFRIIGYGFEWGALLLLLCKKKNFKKKK
ncbi:TPA: hypothetical protein DIC20_04930 [Candidatus Dependentiae bacterium]|nr:MAG: hypothetical protein US13_C0007G0024 [candidate division TM6 bacterium GW2011_GWE2_36_25]HBR71086.1 hypothetical protein [Candidatus Dependentiae bacterium]HCU01018.1 hypothetical protein [Candidatus Dependentiae bacterium]